MAEEKPLNLKLTACELDLPQGDRLDALLARAERGDQEVLPELRTLLDANPAVWQAVADLARQAEEAQIEVAAGEDQLLRESLCRKLEEMRSEIGGPDPSPLEKLLIDRVAITWLMAAYADVQVAEARNVSVKQATFVNRRAEQAHRRFSFSVRQLASLRKLLPKPRGRQEARVETLHVLPELSIGNDNI
jgi:hypothetical protein